MLVLDLEDADSSRASVPRSSYNVPVAARRSRSGGKRPGARVGEALARVTWADLTDWAGERSVSRGRSYARQRRVEELGRCSEGLVAWVRGGTRYATRVVAGAGEGAVQLRSACTCPVGADGCKHAVAVVVTLLEGSVAFADLPAVPDDDERLARIKSGEIAFAGGGTEALGAPDFDAVEAYLGKLSRRELVRLLVDAARDLPDLADRLEETRARVSGEPRRLMELARREMNRLWPDPEAYGHGHATWDPDAAASKLHSLLQGLRATGAADALVDLGPDLLARASEAVVSAHDEGELGCELSPCLGVVLEAARDSSLSPVEQVLYGLDLERADDYDLIGSASDPLFEGHGRKTWGNVADTLVERLGTGPGRAGDDHRHADWERRQLLGQALHALTAAGRRKEADRLEFEEAARTGEYRQLVTRLIEERRLDEAAQSALRALQRAEYPDRFREDLHTIAVERKDWRVALAYRTDAFLARPSLQTLQSVIEDAGRARKKTKTRAAMLSFLETGVLEADVRRDLLGPLPREARRNYSEPAPRPSVLLELALAEKRPRDVVRWYDVVRSGSRFRWGVNRQAVAAAVAPTHPERAIEIYEALAESEIARVSPAAYAVAGRHLQKTKAIYRRLGRTNDWRAKLAAIREDHRRKVRLMEVLDGLEGRPIARPRRP